MPRAPRRKICCVHDEDVAKEKAKAARATAKARRAALTPEEKEEKELEAAERSITRKVKKQWEESLTVWTAPDPSRGKSFPNGTRVRCSYGRLFRH